MNEFWDQKTDIFFRKLNLKKTVPRWNVRAQLADWQIDRLADSGIRLINWIFALPLAGIAWIERLFKVDEKGHKDKKWHVGIQYERQDVGNKCKIEIKAHFLCGLKTEMLKILLPEKAFFGRPSPKFWKKKKTHTQKIEPYFEFSFLPALPLRVRASTRVRV